MGVVLQAQQRMLRVAEDTPLDSQFGPRGATDRWLSGRAILLRETGTDVTNRDRLDVSWNVTVSNIVSIFYIDHTDFPFCTFPLLLIIEFKRNEN